MTQLPPVKIPHVARNRSHPRLAPFAFGLGVIGTAVFAGLAGHRAARQDQLAALPPLRATSTTAPAAPPPAIAGTPAVSPASTALQAPPAASIIPVPVEPAHPSVIAPAARARRSDDSAEKRARDRIAAPALIVDLPPAPTGEDDVRAAPSAPVSPTPLGADRALPAASMMHTASLQDPTGAAIAAAGPPPPANVVAPIIPVTTVDNGQRDLNSNERFANRANNKETEVVRAQRLPNQESLVIQGTIIGAVMETALDSDLPGFARAVVTRDVLSFDGSQVLIPAGSHVIGEYNSGVAQGASRIFIVWNRLVRPDGVTVSLGSPAVDDLGRGGLSGKVNRHFFQRYGGAILLSVLGGSINAFTQSRSRGSTVIVGTSTQATSLGNEAQQSNDIPPTIKTPQGANVRIFVARDLDFSAVGPMF